MLVAVVFVRRLPLARVVCRGAGWPLSSRSSPAISCCDS
jgi:hypothetical protein